MNNLPANKTFKLSYLSFVKKKLKEMAGGGGGSTPTPSSLMRVTTVENRVFNTFENRAAAVGVASGTVNWFVHTLHVIGSGSVKDVTCLIDGYYKQAGQAETNLPAGMVITKMHLQVVGEAPVPLLIGVSRSYTITPGESNTEGTLLTAAQMKAAVTLLPIGTKFWFKAEGTILFNGSIPSSVRHKDDAVGTQFGWYNPANTTIVNGVDVAGPFTWTGTNADLRNNGWSPMFVGHYQDGTDPVNFLFVGDSNTQGLQDNGANETGRGWPQNVLTGDATSSPSTGYRSGINLGISGDSGVSLTGATKLLSKQKYCTDNSVNTGANDLGQAGVGSVTTTHNARVSIKNTLAANAVGSRPPKTIVLQFHPQSTSGNPTKTINSAPNTEWGVGEKAAQVNALAAAAVGTDFYAYATTPSIRQNTDNTNIDHYRWKFTGGTNVYDTTYTPDGQHASNIGVLAIKADVNPVFRSIAP